MSKFKIKNIFFTFICFSLFFSNANASKWGTGELKLTDFAIQSLQRYLSERNPLRASITIDGDGLYWFYCPEARCTPGPNNLLLSKCKSYYKKPCKMFILRKSIKWENGINPGGKEARLRGDMTLGELKEKLTQLGFYGDINASASKKTGGKKQIKGDISEKLENLNKLYESGALTKEEFSKAKKKILK